MRPILIKGHERALTQIKFNKDGDLLFSVAKDLIVNVWYSHNGERLGTYRGHQGAIWTVDVDAKCQLLATGAADNTVKLWNVQSGECLLTYEMQNAVKRVEFSSDSKRLLAVTEQRMGITGAINVLNVPTFDELINEKTHQEIKGSESSQLVLETPEGALKCNVAGWSYLDLYIIACHEDGSVRKYDAKSGEILNSQQVHSEAKPENPLETRTPGNISDIQFSPDRTYFITASRDRISKLLDVDEFEILKEFIADTPLNTSSITPIKDFVILGGGQEARNVTTTSQHQGKFEARFHHKIFQDEIGRVKGHFGPLNTLAVHPLGTSYASGGEDGYVRIHHFDKSYFDFVYDVERY